MTMALPVIATHTIDTYIDTVFRLPMLTEQEEHDLAVKHFVHGDHEAAKQLTVSHLRMVVSIAREYYGYGLQLADLIQEGNIGLMKAVKRFDPSIGVRLAAYAVQWIKSEIKEFVIRNWRIVKMATTKAQRKLFFNLRSMRETTDTLSPTKVDEIAALLDVKPEEVVAMETRFSTADASLEKHGGDSEDDDSYAPIDYLVDTENEPTVVLEKLEYEHAHSVALYDVINKLDDRSKDIVISRWLTEPAIGLKELSVKYGVSMERIRQIEVNALKKMKTLM